MYIQNESSNRTTQKGESYGLPHEEFDEEPPPYPHYGGQVERKASFNFPQAGSSYGSLQTPSPQIFSDLQKEQRLGEKTIYEKMRSSFNDTDEEFINKVKRPLLHDDYQTNNVHQETKCCCRLFCFKHLLT
jgi:hypothetical protein